MAIAVLGSVNTDITINVAAFAGRNETVVGERDYVLSQGGKGANQAAAAAAAGAVTHMIGRVGNDSFGASAVENLIALGVGCGNVLITPEAATGLAAILVDAEGNNIITVAPGANTQLTVADVERAAATIRDAAALIVQLETPLETVEAAINLAYAHAVPVILNPAPAPKVPLHFLDKVEVLVPNQHEARQFAALLGHDAASPEEAAQALLLAGARNVVVTLGDEGCLVMTPKGAQRIEPFQVDAVDTTGAGDVFCGYLAARFARGDDLLDAARTACAAGALSVMRPQARAHLPTCDEVLAFAGR